jgi:acyl carrier protein
MIEKVIETVERETGQKVTAETSLDDLGLDSLEFISLVLAVGEATGKTIPDEKIAGLTRVEDLARELE